MGAGGLRAVRPFAGAAHHLADIAATGASFSATLAVQIVSVPLLLGLLGQTNFAAFQVIISLLAWAALVPMGLDRALKNVLSTARAAGADDRNLRRGAWLLSLGMLAGATVLLVVLGGALSRTLVAPLAGRPFEVLFVAAVLTMLLHGLGNLGREALLAEHRGRTVAWLQIGNMGAILVALLLLATITPELRPGNTLLALALAAWLAPHAVAGIAALVLARLPTTPRKTDWKWARPLMAPAFRFILFSLATTALYASDYLVLARLADPPAVVLYSVCSRVTGAFALLCGGILALYWPRWAEDLARGDTASVRRSVLRQAALWGALSLALIALLLPFFESVCRLWLGDPNFVAPPSTIILMGIALALRTWCDTFATALLAASRPGRLTIVFAGQAGLTIAAQFALYPSLGLNGIFAGFALGAIASSAWLLPAVVLRVYAPALRANGS